MSLRQALAQLALLVAIASPGVAHADDEEVSGRTEERELEGDTGREVAEALLFVPRVLISNILRAQGLAARFAFDSRLVPTDERTDRKPHIYAFPTVFAETSKPLSVGARMLVVGGPFVTSHRVGFGGVDELVAENGVQYADRYGGTVFNAAAEGLVEQKSDIAFYGVGASPSEDARNRFRGRGRIGYYDEKRTRILAAASVRPIRMFEIAGSFSATRRMIDDADETGLFRVFQPNSVASWGPDTWLGYGELALRIDTRRPSGPAVPGFVAETYAGYASQLKGADVEFLRVGGRAQGFIPIVRPTNLLSLRLIVDGVRPFGDAPVPFTELAGQPAFRGLDRGRDATSYVGSVDYIWQFSSNMSTRLFVDMTTVAPAVDEIDFGALRWAAGTQLSFHSSVSDIARFGVAGSPDGVHFSLAIGSVDRWGDRLRRD